MKQTTRELVHRLAYSWTGWPQSEPLLPEPAADFLAALDEAWSCDGLHRISHRWQPDIIQFTFEAGPDISPQKVAARAKGRLDHALRAHGWRVGLARKVALRSLGENTLETVLHYIATQLDRADLADPRYVRTLADAAWVDGDVDLSEPLASGHGRYWYNLHLVWSAELGASNISAVGRDKPVRAGSAPPIYSAADGLAPPERKRPRPGVHSLAVMPDHVHVSMRAPTDATPREVADGLRRALNLAAGCALFSPRMYVGTFSDYALSAIRQRY